MRVNQTALCVVRTWTEENSPVLRAEISMTTDSPEEIPRHVYVTGAADVVGVVREWLIALDPNPPLSAVEIL
jgi:hypothetical protein